MKTSKKILSIVLCLIMIFGSVAVGGEKIANAIEMLVVQAHADDVPHSGTCGENTTWNLDDQGTLKISGSGETTNYSSSSDVPWFPLTTLISTVIINDGVTSIGDHFFDSPSTYYETKYSNLISVSIGNSVTFIGEYAFRNCSNISRIFLPNSVISIGKNAFSNCVGLTDLTLSNSITVIGAGAFYKCTGLADIVIPNSVTTIGKNAFRECSNITNLNIGNGVTTINDSAFDSCSSLTEITLPESLTSIGSYVFYGCTSIQSLSVSARNSVYCSINNCIIEKATKTLVLGCINSIIPTDGSVTKIGDTSFAGITNLTNITIPSCITNIGNYSFEDCKGLTYVTIPNGVTIIGEGSFDECSSLANVSIPSSVTSIGNYAFFNCSSLSDVFIPNSVLSIGDDAFKDVKRIIYNGNATGAPWGSYFADELYTYSDIAKTQLTGHLYDIAGDLVLPSGIISVEPMAFHGCSEITSLTIPDSLTNICYSAFYGCSGITSLIIPNSVTNIGDEAFYGCTKLTDITIGNNVNIIGNHAFSYCKGITSISIPSSVTSIGKSAFSRCPITSISVDPNNPYYHCDGNCLIETNTKTLIRGCSNSIIPNDGSVISIDSFSFCGCTEPANIVVPNSVKTLNKGAFYEFYGLQSITIADSVTYIGAYAFEDCTSLISATLPKNITFIGYELFRDCISLKNVNIPYGVKTIEYQAFCRCSSLESITIPDSVTSMEDGAFSSCKSLKRVNISDLSKWCNISFEDYGDSNPLSNYAFLFLNDFKITELVIPNDITTIKNYAFSHCAGLTSIILHNNITSIGNEAFESCREITSLIIPNGVSSIGNTAFEFCSNLVSIILPKSVETLGDSAFAFCENLSDVYYGGSELDKQNINSVYLSRLDSKTWHYNADSTPCKVTFNVNGGEACSFFNKTVVFNSKYGALPIAEKNNFIFDGWYTSADGGSQITESSNVKIESNHTLYAHWKTPSSFSLSNRFWFSNSSDHFKASWSGNKNFVTKSDSEKLFNYIRKYDSNSSGTITAVQNYINHAWEGSCYGMATTSILDYRNKIAFNENFDTNATTMHDVKSPSTSENIMSAINYYHVAQKISFIRNSSSYYNSARTNWSAGLKKLVSVAQNGAPFLFCYAFYAGGHAIVPYDCVTEEDGSYSLIAYDNRYPDNEVNILIDSDYSSCVIETPYNFETATSIEFNDDMDVFDYIDIDGPNNDLDINYSSFSDNNNSTEIEVVADSDVTVFNADGETITISDGEITSTMNIISTHMIVNSTVDGNPAPVTYVFDVDESSSFTVESEDNSIEASVKTESMYVSATANNANSVVFGNGEGVYVIGNNMDYSTAISSKNSAYDTVIVEGKSDKDVSLTYSGNNIIIGGVTDKNEKITIFMQNTNSEKYSVKEGYKDVQITTDTSSNIDILGSSNNDGNYDLSVVVKEDKEFTAKFVVDGKTVSENKYKEGETIVKPANPSKDGYTFKCWTPNVPTTMPSNDMTFTAVFEKNNPTKDASLKISANTEVEYAATVTVKAKAANVPEGYYVALYDGKTLLKKGSNTEVSYTFPGEFKETKNITVKIIDDNGNVQKDGNGKELTGTVEIKAKSGFFAKLIAFFKRLFKALPEVTVEPK